MRIVDLIIKKKMNEELTKEEIYYLIDSYVKDEMPDYQMSALLMAINLNGLSEEEQVNLTYAMLESGEQIDLSKVKGIKVDKHSTGGVGDKTTLVVAPIIASFGIVMAKMSGRGLGHTGGTLDKLESIPGFQINLSQDEFIKQINDIKLSVVGQTLNIVPADKKLYALRDVTGTVESVGLIASSIMSKKLASGADYILLDVKVGDGAFMKDLDDARELASAMVAIGLKAGRNTVAMLTDMDQPLGEAVGNSLEVIEAIETLKGKGPEDFKTLCFEISAEILLLTKYSKTKEEALKLIENSITSGAALYKLMEMIAYQGGNANIIHDYKLLPTAKYEFSIKSALEGYVKKIHTLEIGNAAMILGAGRKTKDDNIDLAVGLRVLKKVGDFINKGDILAKVYANTSNIDEVEEIIIKAFELTNDEVQKNTLILDIIA